MLAFWLESCELFGRYYVLVSAMYILMVLHAFVLLYLICSAKVSFGSRARLNIFGNGLVARIKFFVFKLRD